jgi:hypothetical protein
MAYQTRNYAEAQKVYEELASDGLRSPHLYFNLGNTYYQLGRRGMAAWMYEKALAVAPRNGDARRNLSLARPFRGKVSAGAGSFLFWPLAWISSRFTDNEWIVGLEAIYLFTALCAIFWILFRPSASRRWARLLTLVGTGAMLLVAAFAIPRVVDARMNHYGVVVQSGAVVRSAPGPSEPEYFEAREGEKFQVTDSEVQGWLRVKRPDDGRVGYLPEGLVRKI